MKTNEGGNRWAVPFERLLARQDLADLMTRRAPQIRGMESLPAETAPQVLRMHLESIYIANEPEVAWARTNLGLGHAHALKFYSTARRFAEDLHRKDLSLSPNPVTRMTTSEAGWGKSELAGALVRLFSDPATFEVGHSLPHQRVVGIVRLSIDANTGTASLLNTLAKQAGFPQDYSSGGASAIAQIRRQMFIAGVMLIIADEFQFLAQSASASALIAKTLHFLRQIGLPLIFIANYSLGHKLLKRPQEDQHRFLVNPEVLLPDARDSRGFRALISAYVEAMGSCLQLDPVADAKMLHWYTGGNRRIFLELVVLAYAEVRRTAAVRGSVLVTMNDLGSAYASIQFTPKRNDVELCRKQLVENKMARADLWCPFPLSPLQTDHRASLARELQRSEIEHTALRSAATPEEVAGMRAMQAVFTTTEPGVQVPAKPRREKKKRETVEDLLATRPSYYG